MVLEDAAQPACIGITAAHSEMRPYSNRHLGTAGPSGTRNLFLKERAVGPAYVPVRVPVPVHSHVSYLVPKEPAPRRAAEAGPAVTAERQEVSVPAACPAALGTGRARPTPPPPCSLRAACPPAMQIEGAAAPSDEGSLFRSQ
jgi:hypothetical protein